MILRWDWCGNLNIWKMRNRAAKATVNPCWANDALQLGHQNQMDSHTHQYLPPFHTFRWHTIDFKTCPSYHKIPFNTKDPSSCFLSSTNFYHTLPGLADWKVLTKIMSSVQIMSPLLHFQRGPSFTRTHHFSKRLNFTAHILGRWTGATSHSSTSRVCSWFRCKLGKQYMWRKNMSIPGFWDQDLHLSRVLFLPFN